MISDCFSMSIMVSPPISIGSVMVFLIYLTFQLFERKSCIFLILWIMFAGGFSMYARYQILLSMA